MHWELPGGSRPYFPLKLCTRKSCRRRSITSFQTLTAILTIFRTRRVIKRSSTFFLTALVSAGPMHVWYLNDSKNSAYLVSRITALLVTTLNFAHSGKRKHGNEKNRPDQGLGKDTPRAISVVIDRDHSRVSVAVSGLLRVRTGPLTRDWADP